MREDAEEYRDISSNGRDIDVTSGRHGSGFTATGEGSSPQRPWIGIRFECCGVYSRIYRDVAVQAYEGRCPRCGLSISVAVASDGLDARILRARPV